MKKFTFSIAVGLATLAMLLVGCKNDFEETFTDTNEIENHQENITSEVVKLGSQRENPFLSSSRQAVTDNDCNYIYFRIRTDDYEKFGQIENILGELQTIPLDYEVEEGGCVNPENEGTETYSTWFYAMKPIEVFEELKAFGEIEEISRMYLSEEDLEAFSADESDSARFLWSNYKSVKPTGYVKVYDEILKEYVPVEGVKVTVSQWCHVKSVYTDENGYYNIGSKFTTCWQNTANIRITFISKNGDFICPGFSPAKAWYNAGDKKVADLTNCTILLAKDTSQANYGSIIKAATEYRKFAKTDKITVPNDVKFWTMADMSGGVTLMRDVMESDFTAVGAAIGTVKSPGLGTLLGSLGGTLIGAYLPDVIIGLKHNESITNTESIMETVFHEMAHTSHFYAIGTGKVTYWNLEYIKMLGGWINVIKNGESPFENCYNDGSSEQVCFIESWGYFYGFYLMNRYYNNLGLIINQYKDILEESSLDIDDYFYYKAYYDLIDNINEDSDECSDYTVKQIFEPYKYFSVQSISSWYNKFKEQNKLNEPEQTAVKNTFLHNGVTL